MRASQSSQSVPNLHEENLDEGPPSSHCVSFANTQVLVHMTPSVKRGDTSGGSVGVSSTCSGGGEEAVVTDGCEGWGNTRGGEGLVRGTSGGEDGFAADGSNGPNKPGRDIQKQSSSSECGCSGGEGAGGAGGGTDGGGWGGV